MKESAQQILAPWSALRFLAADRLLQVSVALYVAALAVLAISPTEATGPTEVARNLVDPILVGLTLLALLSWRSQAPPAERRFWDLLALAWTSWLLVDLVYFFHLGTPFLPANLIADTLYVIYYLIFAAAVDLRPHQTRELSLTARGRRLEAMAGLAAMFGLLIYFAIVVLPPPLGLSLSFGARADGFTPLLLVRVSLDLLLLGRLIFAAFVARGRWRRLYAFLASGMLAYALRDALSLLRYEGIITSPSSLGAQAFLYMPGLIFLVAARYRLVPTVEISTVRPTEAEGKPAEPVRPNPIALYSILVPGLHFLFYALGWLDAASRGPRGVFCLVYILILGGIAWVHQSVLAEDTRGARAALLEAEQSLSASRKLESVGRLAGGIAHDFNNYLTVIRGYCELLQESLKGSKEAADLEYIEDAARKATHLTRQLLAFGRRQVLRPEPLDLNAVVRDTGKMLNSLLGEDVMLQVNLDPGAGLARADLGQTEQLLVNLAINGRDAMPSGGKLSIRTRRIEVEAVEAAQLDVEPGSYVSLVVADTGVGMSEEIRRQAFEPFFTTKELGRGTGLGLSTVYGVVTQSGGAITVDSVLGQGTSFNVLLPSATAVEDIAAAPESEVAPQRGGARLLLVEDEGGVRRLASMALSQAGFRVSSAGDGAEAVSRYLEDCEELDLLITDVLMPGMDGVELATTFQARCPELRVLFVSGYPADTLRQRQKILPQSLRLLEKPFSPSTLIEAVNEVLDETTPIPVVDDLIDEPVV